MTPERWKELKTMYPQSRVLHSSSVDGTVNFGSKQVKRELRKRKTDQKGKKK